MTKFKLFGQGGLIPHLLLLWMFSLLFFFTIVFPSLILYALLSGHYYLFLFGLSLFAINFFDKAYDRGGTKPFLRGFKPFWEMFASYFNCRLIFEDAEKLNRELGNPSANSPVLFAVHPHGVFSIGIWTNFIPAADSSDLTRQFPPLSQMRVVTLDLNFRYPFWNQILGGFGFIGSSSNTIRAALKKGNSVGIVVGGAAESLETNPRSDSITVLLQNRRGFIREALIAGAPIVPVFTFGEVDLYEVYIPKKGSFAHWFQQLMKNLTGFTVPFTNFPQVFRPYPIPLQTVVGPPLVLPKIDSPSLDEIESYKEAYISHLTNFFYRNRHLDPSGIERTLIIK